MLSSLLEHADLAVVHFLELNHVDERSAKSRSDDLNVLGERIERVTVRVVLHDLFETLLEARGVQFLLHLVG